VSSEINNQADPADTPDLETTAPADSAEVAPTEAAPVDAETAVEAGAQPGDGDVAEEAAVDASATNQAEAGDAEAGGDVAADDRGTDEGGADEGGTADSISGEGISGEGGTEDDAAVGDDDDEEDEDEGDDELPAGALEAALASSTADEVEEKGDTEKHWYILKVQSNRETTICDGLKRRAKIAGVEDYFGEIIVPIEMVTEFKNGKKRVVKRKLYPGYIIVNMQITDETWFLVRETPGIGDFTGSAGRPVPMDEADISRFLVKQDEDTGESPKLKIAFNVGDRVKINDGTFENFEGSVDAIDEANGRVTVMTNIFGRSTPVELEYWQIEVL